MAMHAGKCHELSETQVLEPDKLLWNFLQDTEQVLVTRKEKTVLRTRDTFSELSQGNEGSVMPMQCQPGTERCGPDVTRVYICEAWSQQPSEINRLMLSTGQEGGFSAAYFLLF